MADRDADDLLGAPARELFDALSALADDARAVAQRADALDGQVRAAVAACGTVESTGGTVSVAPLSPAADPTGLAAALAARDDLVAGDEALLAAARRYAVDLPPLLAAMRPARSTFRMLWRGRAARDAIGRAVLAARTAVATAEQHGWPARLRTARERGGRGVAPSAGTAYEQLARDWPRHVDVVRRVTGLAPDTPDAPLTDLRTLGTAAALGETATWLVDTEQERRREVHREFGLAREARVRRSLDEVPLSRLREAASIAGLRLTALEGAGLRSVADVLRRSAAELDAIPGVGEVTAKQVYAAARQVADAAAADVRFRLDLDRDDRQAGALVKALGTWSKVGLPLMWLRSDLEKARADLGELSRVGLPKDGVALILRPGDAPPTDFADRVAQWARWWEARHTDVLNAYDQVARAASAAGAGSARSGAGRATAGGSLASDEALSRAWDDFEQRPAEYYSWLSGLVGLDTEQTERGELPDDIVEAIRGFTLDLSLVTASVRGYQEFGAKFALVQGRTLLGDEMGLGKTVQAIAAMAHLAAAGERHALVVCPASVVINWERELARHSQLTAYRLFGEDRDETVLAWARDGGVGVTTYGQLGALTLPADISIAMLVADEAHYLKNPVSQRSRAVVAVLPKAKRALLMSGTPLENRLDEFATLVGYLQPEVLAGIDPAAAMIKATAFRRAVAPVYLRRNQEDVLTELPDLVESDEWVTLTQPDRLEYAAAVASGNFMAMRQAAWKVSYRVPAKLERLIDLVEEATSNGRRVIVFSFFRSVLDRVSVALRESVPGAPVFGPLTGSLSGEARQRLVDDFSTSGRAGVLVSQIEAGGVGLNIQAASVVVLCEPQIKPSSEVQAIARVHRMGQIRTVQVHRLLAANSVDARLLEILAEKEAIFDAYVRESAVSDAAPEAIDVSERNLAARIVAEEQRRLAAGPQDAPLDEPLGAPQDAKVGPQDAMGVAGPTPQDAKVVTGPTPQDAVITALAPQDAVSAATSHEAADGIPPMSVSGDAQPPRDGRDGLT